MENEHLYTITRDNLFRRKPDFENAIMERTVQYAIEMKGSSNWFMGGGLYFYWHLFPSGPRIYKIRVLIGDCFTHETKEEFFIDPLIEENWNAAATTLSSVLRILEEKDKNKTTSFNVKVDRSLPNFKYPGTRYFDNSLSALQKVIPLGFTDKAAIEYSLDPFVEPVKIKISSITFYFEGKPVKLDFLGIVKPYISIKTEDSEYIFTSKPGYGIWKDEKGRLVPSSCGFVPRKKSKWKHEDRLLTRDDIQNAEYYILYLVRLLE